MQSLALLNTLTQTEGSTATWSDPELVYSDDKCSRKQIIFHIIRMMNFATLLTKYNTPPKSNYFFTLLLLQVIVARA